MAKVNALRELQSVSGEELPVLMRPCWIGHSEVNYECYVIASLS